MNIMQKLLFVFSISLLLIHCKSENSKLDKAKLLSHYSSPEDFLKRQAVLFILDNIENHTSEIPVFINILTREEVYLDLDTISDEDTLLEIMSEKSLLLSTKTIPDKKIIDNDFLIKNIDEAFEIWNKYPWAQDIPKDIFFNYLLPYKIYGDKPEDWRYKLHLQLMSEKELISFLEDSISYNEDSSLDRLYKKVIQNIDKKVSYKDNPSHLTRFPSLSELTFLNYGDCIGLSYLYVMALRTLGIPAAVDIVPLWGSKNSGHATDVLWDNKLNKFRTVLGRRLVSSNNFPPSKVFRYSYQKQNTWTDTIEPILGSQPFLLEYLMNDNWIDVTQEHTLTHDVKYKIDESLTSEFAYICVFNYGKWEPVFWGKIDENGIASFKNMSINVLYRIAIPQGNNFQVISDIFKIDSMKNQVFYKADALDKTTLKLQKLNEGSRSWLKKGKIYNLYFFDDSMEWELVEKQLCLKDSILIFDNVPSNALYRIVENDGDKRLERIFTYKDDIHVFY
jgi:Transglutaminase-like enzymes, putative cysteine proteases